MEDKCLSLAHRSATVACVNVKFVCWSVILDCGLGAAWCRMADPCTLVYLLTFVHLFCID